jgi:glycerol-3-phosphate dehydrogenase
MKRSESLAQLRSQQGAFDVCIVGGGATGLGAAVDAASRGHRVCLIERADFAKGTSSRSTKLVHGGVRYLKQGNLPLVMDALRERGRLHANAPHLVHSMAFVIPNYHWWEGPFYGIGMKVYDQLAGELGLEPSRWLSLEETVALIPNIEPQDLTGGVVYHDGQFDDARLAVTLARTAARSGAVLLNYVNCTGLLKDQTGHLCGVQALDIESGEPLEIEAKVVINATGVFVDELRQLDAPESREIVAVSQGVHMVLPREFLPGDAAIMIPKTDDGRVLFAVPWHGRVVVGTTDTPLPEKSVEPRALPEETAFLMQHAARYLAHDPRAEDVLSLYAGLRPLVKQTDAKSTGSTAALSRDHTILVSDSGLITITGGKWTTYRKMGEEVINRAEQVASLPPRDCETAAMKLHGWSQDLPPATAHLQVYGTDAQDIEKLITEDASLAKPLHPELEFLKAEVIWQVRHEMARTVEDVLARRTRALLLNAKASIEAAPVVAELMARELGKDETWSAASAAGYEKIAAGYVFH